jgi:hypothetical protein
MSNTLYIKELHQLHISWNSVLDLTRDEILSFEKRLQEIVKVNTDKSILAQAEHFQNQFIRQKEVMDELRHDIHEDELRIAQNVKENSVAAEHRKLEENFELKKQFEKFNKLFIDLKIEYFNYLGNNL